MPYPMSHLFIAERILAKKKLNITNIPQYYLGILAPDAVHFRKNFDISHKTASHLYSGLDRKNVEILTKNWKKNVRQFYAENSSRKTLDFLTGYCIHLMADIYNCKYIWTPFRSAFGNGREKLYRKECMAVDLEIFRREQYEKNIFSIIGRAKVINFSNLLTKDELHGLKNNILNIQYKNRRPSDTSKNKYLSYEKMKEHNNKMTKFILRELPLLRQNRATSSVLLKPDL